MAITKIELKKIVPTGERFNVEFQIAYEDINLSQTYYATVTIGVPFDAELSYDDLSRQSHEKLGEVVKSWGPINDDVAAKLSVAR